MPTLETRFIPLTDAAHTPPDASKESGSPESGWSRAVAPEFRPLWLWFCLVPLYFAGLGFYPLIDPDEPVYGQVAREMAAGAGWLSPHLNGALWFDKPPLFYWLCGLSVKVFGPNEWACRLPSALLAPGVVALVYAWARRDFGTRAAFFSALVMATCLQQIVLARAAVTDMTFVFCLTLALFSYRRWFAQRFALEQSGETLGNAVAPSATATNAVATNAVATNAASRGAARRWVIGCGVATGLATLAKGPVAPVLLSVAFVIHLSWERRLRFLGSLDALLAIFFAFAVGLPWYVAMYLLHGQEFVQGFLVANNITRFLKAEHSAQTGHWYAIFLNIPVFLGFFFPWSAFAPQALMRAWKHSRNREEATGQVHSRRLALVWFGVVFTFFSLSKTQLVTYIFPLYPAAALLVGVFWDEAAREETAQITSDSSTRAMSTHASTHGAAWRGVSSGLWCVLGLSIVLACGLIVATHGKYAGVKREVVVAASVLPLAASAALWTMARRYKLGHDAKSEASQGARLNRASGVLAFGMGALALWLVFGVLPRLGPALSARELVQTLPRFGARSGAGAGAKAQLILFRVRAPSVWFYAPLHEYSYTASDDQNAVRRQLASPFPIIVVCRPADEARFLLPGVARSGSSPRLIVLANEAARSRLVNPREPGARRHIGLEN